VRHLLPISSHPRSRPSTPATQQLGFCNLALSLLEEASFNSVPLPLDINSILPPPSSSSPDDDAMLVNGDSKMPRAAIDPSATETQICTHAATTERGVVDIIELGQRSILLRNPRSLSRANPTISTLSIPQLCCDWPRKAAWAVPAR
jgi:hypothetical protein